MHIHHPEIAKRWEAETPKGKLPHHNNKQTRSMKKPKYPGQLISKMNASKAKTAGSPLRNRKNSNKKMGNKGKKGQDKNMKNGKTPGKLFLNKK